MSCFQTCLPWIVAEGGGGGYVAVAVGVVVAVGFIGFTAKIHTRQKVQWSSVCRIFFLAKVGFLNQ